LQAPVPNNTGVWGGETTEGLDSLLGSGERGRRDGGREEGREGGREEGKWEGKEVGR